MASTTLVELGSPASIAKELATSVFRMVAANSNGTHDEARAEAQAFISACKADVQASNFSSFVSHILDVSTAVLAHPDEKSVESCFSVVIALVKVADADKQIGLVRRMCGAVTEDTEHRPSLRLRIISNVYNLLERNSTVRFAVFLEVIKYASATNQLKLLLPYLSDADTWVEKWALTMDRARELFLLLAECLDTAGEGAQAYDFLVKYLSTFDEADPATLATVKDKARTAILSYIRTVVHTTHSKHIIDMPAVRQLEGDEAYGGLFELLNIVSTQTAAEFIEYAAAHKEYIAELRLDESACLESVRLLSLCTLAAEFGDSPVPYARVAETLKVEVDTVESWVIRAIDAGLITARMDQMSEEVFVSRYTQRVFAESDWLELQRKLHAWSDNITSLMSTLDGSA